MQPLYLVVQEEIGLEGLDGITLDALWFRLSERLKLELPLNKNFREQIWKLVKSYKSVEFFKIKSDRRTPERMDRKDYLFNENRPKDEIEAFMKLNYFIYSYDPVDHSEVRGSCKEFKTRKPISAENLKEISLDDVTNMYNQRLVIVASQAVRNSLLIPKNAGLDCDINNHAYCVLERIGRARHFGEMTSGPFSINDFVKDSKLIHYFRNTLLKHGVVVRQQIQKKVRGNKLLSQLFHLPRYLVIIRTGIALQTEQLFEMLQTKPTLMVELSEARKELGINQKALKLVVQTKNEVFKITEKCPYRKCYPDAKEAQYLNKNQKTSVEKTVGVVELLDPDFDVYMTVDKADEEQEPVTKGFLDISRQQYNLPLSHQVCQKIEESAKTGMSQLEIGNYFGLTKLNARSVVRNISRHRDISFYMKDEGRQRVSKYVTKNAAEDASATFIAEMTKLLKKADDLTTAVPKADFNSSQSPTKVSIQLPPETLQHLKDEPPSSRPIITYTLQGENGEPIDMDAIQWDEKETQLVIPFEESSFIDNVENVAVNLRFLNNIPNIKNESAGIAKALMQNRISQKVLNRMNAVLNLIESRTVIEAIKLHQILREQEREKEDTGEMCRRSMFSLCSKLAADNFLKVIEMELKSDKKTVVLLFFGEPNISFDRRCWHSIIEEQKLLHFIPFHRTQDEISGLQLTESKTSVASEEFGPQSKRYENFPKFMKMKLFHEFLYYLIYAFPESHRKIPISKALESWKQANPKVKEYDNISEKIQNCYSTEISWKMFVPPLNQQITHGDGWGLLRDIIHRIPLILFVKFTRMVSFSRELQEYLDHPIKSNYLLHFLPAIIREQLLRGRKYVFVVQDLCKKLAWCGLLQFGPSRTKEIDQTMVYLNRNASLWDTTSSDEGYMEVSKKTYPVVEYTFHSIDDVTNYWNTMYQISINTKINKKSTAVGKTVEVEQINLKASLQGALKAQTPESARENDNGSIPGDHKGAAGMDKALLAHLVQNWTRPIGSRKSKHSRSLSAASLSSKLSVASTAKPKKKAVKKKKSVVKETAKKIKNKTIQAAQSKFKSKATTSTMTKVIQKTAQTHVEKQKKLIAQDIVDKQALKMMKTMRVTWSDVEDQTLLLVKVALKFLFPIEAQSIYYINGSIIRDILHWRTDKALNKTTKACARRIQYLMKIKPSFKEQIALYIEELRANREMMARYKNFIDRLKKIYNAELIHDAVKVHFVDVVHRIHQIFNKQFLGEENCASTERVLDLPSNFEDLKESFIITNPIDSLVTRKYKDPQTLAEAEIAMLVSLIHSSVCCSQDKVSYSTQLFEIFKKFTDPVLNSAVSQLRRASIISGNKKEKSKGQEKDKKSILPYSFSPYHLTTRYATQMAGIHVPVELYDEYFGAVKALSEANGPCLIANTNCGWIFMASELRNCRKVRLSYDQADSLVMVDPALIKKTTFDKISDNYLQMMKKSVKDKEKKSVKLPPDDTSNETFFFIDDPIEIFMKIDAVYLHVFCVIGAIVKGDDVVKKRWCLNEDGECSLKNCLVKDDLSFADNARKVAEQSCEMLKEILEKRKYSSKVDSPGGHVTKHNFLEFFQEVLENHFAIAGVHDVKDFSSKPKRPKKLALTELLESIVTLATEPGLEQDSWITEYKKISKTAEEENLDDEDAPDTSVDTIKNTKLFSQLKDLNVNNRTCDSFVVNLSTIYVEADQDFGSKIRFDDGDFGLGLLPFDEVDRTAFIEKILSEVKFTPEELAETDLFEAVTNAGITNTLEIMKVSEVCDFVQSKSEMGATSSELLYMFADKHQTHAHMEILIRLKFVFRVGVTETRFVHKDFAAFWLVDSFYTTRENVSEVGDKRKAGGGDEGEPAKKRMKSDLCQPSTSKAAMKTDKVVNVKKTAVKCNPLRVRPSPWIRVNGTLNRRVFDKWLGTVLNHLTLYPCMLLSDLSNKFNVLTPFDMRCLCEGLQLIGCVEMMATAEKSHDLFSSFDGCGVEPATFFCSPDCVFVEVKEDAMLRLTFFIGKKKYRTPFV